MWHNVTSMKKLIVMHHDNGFTFRKVIFTNFLLPYRWHNQPESPYITWPQSLLIFTPNVSCLKHDENGFNIHLHFNLPVVLFPSHYINKYMKNIFSCIWATAHKTTNCKGLSKNNENIIDLCPLKKINHTLGISRQTTLKVKWS